MAIMNEFIILVYKVFKTADNYLMVGAGNDKQFREVCKILKLESLASNPKYRTNANRVQHREELVQLLSQT